MNNKKMIAAVAVLLLTIAALLGVYAMAMPETAKGAKEYSVTVIHSDGSQNVYLLDTDAEFLSDALLAEGLIAGEDGAYGLTVITVDGEDAVWDRDNAYWCIYIGEEMATVGISQIPVYDGSAFTLEYTALG